MEEGKGERYLASGRQYGNALLGVRHQEEEGRGIKLIFLTKFPRVTKLFWVKEKHLAPPSSET